MRRFTVLMMLCLILSSSPVMGQTPRYTQINLPPASSGNGNGTSYTTGVKRSVPVQAQVLKSPQAILEELRIANQFPPEINPTLKIQQSNVLNAATDGQTILITQAMLDRLKTTDQRAFVISHELSHIALNHIAKTQVRQIGLTLLDRLFLRRYIPEGGIADFARSLGLNLYDRRSSRVYEYEADDVGIQLMAQAGYNPNAALEVFRILQEATPGNQTPEFLRTHPMTESRIQALVRKHSLSQGN